MIYAIGRNYAAHAREMGYSGGEAPKKAESPIVFFKPDASIVLSGEKVQLPHFSQNVQYEVELAFRFGPSYEVKEICVANDLTARDKQRDAQENKKPWGLAKGFKQSCGLGNWVSAQGVDVANLELKLTHNDKLTQHGFTKDMIFDVPTIISYLRECFPVQPGDIVLTGTPEGVATLKAGDRVVAELVGLSRAQWTYE